MTNILDAKLKVVDSGETKLVFQKPDGTLFKLSVHPMVAGQTRLLYEKKGYTFLPDAVPVVPVPEPPPAPPVEARPEPTLKRGRGRVGIPAEKPSEE